MNIEQFHTHRSQLFKGKFVDIWDLVAKESSARERRAKFISGIEASSVIISALGVVGMYSGVFGGAGNLVEAGAVLAVGGVADFCLNEVLQHGSERVLDRAGKFWLS